MLEIEKRIEKFRAYNKEDKAMDYNGGSLFDSADINIPKYLCLNTFIKKISDDFVLMRFTGSHDNNGKEIYEGDLVKWHEQIINYNETFKKNDDIFGLVLWDREDCGFKVVQLTKGQWLYKIGESIFEQDTEFYSYDGAEFLWKELEVVGNIYEHYDLYIKLKEKDMELC